MRDLKNEQFFVPSAQNLHKRFTRRIDDSWGLTMSP